MGNESTRPSDPDRLAEHSVLGHAGALRKPHKESGTKKRRPVTLAALVIVAGLTVGGVLLAGRSKPEQEEVMPPRADAAQRLIHRSADDLAEVTLRQAEGDYTIIFTGEEKYHMKDFPNFTVDESKARNLASSCVSIQYDGVVETPMDISAYGLDDPAATVEILFTDGTARAFTLGDKAPSGLRYYLMEQGQEDVYLVYASVGAAWSRTRQEMHVASLSPITAEQIRQASLTGPEGDTITVGVEPGRKSLGVSNIWLSSPVEYEANAENVTEYFQNIAAVAVERFIDEATAETLAQYGLNAPRYHLVAHGKDEAGQHDPIRELHIGGDCGDDAVYARIDNTNDVYTIRRDSVAFLASISTAKLIDRFANIINIAHVDRVLVAGDGVDETFEIERIPSLDANGEPRRKEDGAAETVEVFTIGGEPADDTTFRKLYQLLIGTLADGLLPGEWAPADNEKPALTVTYQLNGERGNEVTEYLPYNTEHYAVRRNGICLFYILKSRVDIIPAAMAAYHDGSFDPKKFGL